MQIERYGLVVATLGIPLKSHVATPDYSWPKFLLEFGEIIEEILSPKSIDPAIISNASSPASSSSAGAISVNVESQRRGAGRSTKRTSSQLIKIFIYLSCVRAMMDGELPYSMKM